MAPICAFFIFGLVSVVVSVPVSIMVNENSSNKEDLDDLEVIDDDITTRSMERLSSAATCLVAGIEYTHGQQINRIDPCEFCLCLDGEMFCWWQDCPPAVEGPCKDRGPFSQCSNFPVSSEISQQASSTKPSLTNSIIQNQQNIQQSKDPSKTTTSESTTISSTYETDNEIKQTSTTQSSQFCIVMGIQYKVGDKLPHDTGNCVECVCGPGAKITCSPHQCAPAGEEMNDFHPSEPRRSNTDNF